MLAPEEVFSGKGDIKEDKELTKTDRKRRRAKKKRQFKGEVLTWVWWLIDCILCLSSNFSSEFIESNSAESVKRVAVKAQLSTLKKPDNGNFFKSISFWLSKFQFLFHWTLGASFSVLWSPWTLDLFSVKINLETQGPKNWFCLEKFYQEQIWILYTKSNCCCCLKLQGMGSHEW